MLNGPMIFAALALTVVVAATATATGPAQPLVEMKGSVSAPPTWLPPAASNSTLSLRGRALTITAGADACTGNSTGLAAAECSAWLDMYDGTGGTDSGVQNATVSVIEQCALSLLTD
jgi:hypothetical protein